MSNTRWMVLLCLILALFSSCSRKDPVLLTIGTFAGSAWNVPNPETFYVLDEAIRRFEQQYPGIQVVYKSGILRNDYSEWLSQTILTGSEPDCFFVLPEDFPLFADIGILEPLDSFLQESEALQDMQFFETTLQAGSFNGVLYGLPTECDPSLVFVNTTLLEQFGLPFPHEDWTWDELLALSTAVTRDVNDDGYLDFFGIAGFSWREAIYTNGLNFFNDTGTLGLFDSEAVYESFKYLLRLQGLVRGEKIPDFWDGNVLFSVSKYSWYRAYGYYPYSILKSGKFKWKATVLPRGPLGKNASELDVLSLGISHRSNHKEEAKLFIEFMLTDEGIQKMHLMRSRGVPASQKTLDSGGLKSILLDDITLEGDEISMQTLAHSINQSVIYPSFRKYPGAIKLINNYLSEIVGSEDKLRNSLYHLNNELNTFLKK